MAKKDVLKLTEKALPEVKDDGRKLEFLQKAVFEAAHNEPTLEDLTKEQIETIVKMTYIDGLKSQFGRRVNVERVDYEVEKRRWIEGHMNSRYTVDNCRRSIRYFEAWCKKENIKPLDVSYVQADDFIEHLVLKGYAPQTVHTNVNNVSGLFTYLERRYKGIVNPFRGSRVKPKKVPKMKIVPPRPEEILRLVKAAKGVVKATIAVMSYTGMRIGGLPEMKVSGDRFYTMSKTREFSKLLPPNVREIIKKERLPIGQPFKGWKKMHLSDRVRHLTGQLYDRGRLRGKFSSHDFRHAYAVELYEHGTVSGLFKGIKVFAQDEAPIAPHDIVRVSAALGHKTITVTQEYLRSLDLDVSFSRKR